jgi:photosystem II stability/assembly factor-like uncharacterized protein
MKQTLSRRDFSTFAVAAMASLSLPARAAVAQWRQLTTEAYKGKQDDISFIDADHGWYGNGAGKLYRTVDGGITWDKLWDKPGTFIRALGLLPRRHR